MAEANISNNQAAELMRRRFGERSVKKMRQWAETHLPSPSDQPLRILECGSGNGTLLLSFLAASRSPAQRFHLTGIDYSAGALELAKGVEEARRKALADGSYESPEGSEDDGEDEDADADERGDTRAGGSKQRVINDVPSVDWRVGDLLRDDIRGQWDLVLDKGTYDALCLSNISIDETGGRLPSQAYPEKVARLVRDGGFFLITSCNFTEEEIKRRWTAEGLGGRSL